ncbi:hypothetical protein [Microbacterium azadirachtae]|uniref:Uncharacterized protein n=1 Tax=Microbacterium azadirachtae TaxID=582680 RepID=A0A0F0LFA6_9MICO|nr:hypothetical protein [Microbacterium azadirachtae]KJL31907.1 hypothetical protein RS86_03188 [Microbacterium azadirachtae]
MTSLAHPALRAESIRLTTGIAARFETIGIGSTTLDRLQQTLADEDLTDTTPAMTLANELELLMAAKNLLPDDNLAKLRYLLTEGSPALEDDADPDDTDGWSADLTDLPAYSASHAHRYAVISTLTNLHGGYA